MKSHRGRCGKNGPRARRLRGRIPAAGCNREANRAPGRLSPQPGGLKPFADFCLAVSRRPRCFGLLERHFAPAKQCRPFGIPPLEGFSAPPPGGLVRRLRRGSRRSPLWRCSLGRDRCGYRPALAPSKITKCSSSAFMGFNQRFPQSHGADPDQSTFTGEGVGFCFALA